MKKVLIITMALVLILTLAAGCGNADSEVKAANESAVAIQLDPPSEDLDSVAAKQNDAALKELMNSGELMGRTQIAPVNEDWASVTDLD